MSEKKSDIQNFYSGQHVFVSGATGLLGKLAVEKILRSCNDVEKIYLLVRIKKGVQEIERFNDIFNKPVFDILKEKYPNFREKVVLMNGDCVKNDLGLSPEDKETFQTKITSIFHIAATVRFDQNLKTASFINVRAVRDLVRMAKTMNQLKAFVYVSTAYSNCPDKHIKEDFHKPPISSKNLLELVNLLDDETIANITPHIIKRWPNTYVFTKCIAEEVLQTEGQNLPITVIRPAIVIPTFKEPFPGWIDNIYGAVGVVLGVASGLLRTMPADPNCNAELVPADYVVNTSLASAWDISENRSEKSVKIYNYTSSKQIDLTWGSFFKNIVPLDAKFPLSKAIWTVDLFGLRPHPLHHKLAILVLHLIPAYIIDTIIYCIGKKPLMVDAYRRIHKFLDMIGYFARRNWDWEDANMYKLLAKMSDRDKELFTFQINPDEILDQMEKAAVGGRLHLLKDPLETVPQALALRRKLKIAHYSLMTFLVYLVYRFLMFLFKCLF